MDTTRKKATKSLCPFCLAPGACTTATDKRGQPFLSCKSCGSRAFMKARPVGIEMLTMVVERLDTKLFGFLLNSYDPELVLRVLEDELDTAFDAQVTRNLARALHDITGGGKSKSGSQAELVKLLAQLDGMDAYMVGD